ncbi:LamG-like jellyroll fold domain-containing protein [Streptomyces sp. NPDC005017]|uniref:Tc toxin subunit A-related protein n=1 Tax=Streptomyces sp. NPDC005017 TaxID=3364706 RepID=UPI00367EC471
MAGITIESPADGTSVVVGSTVRIAGSTEPFEPDDPRKPKAPRWPKLVTVSIDGGPQQEAIGLDANWGAWEAQISVDAAGARTVRAVAHWSLGNGMQEEDVLVVQGVATLALAEPTAPVSTVEFPVAVSAGPPDTRSVRARADGQAWVDLQPNAGRWEGRLRLADQHVPPGGRKVGIDLQATRDNGRTYEGAGQVTAVDATLPVVLAFTPSDGSKLPGSGVGAVADVVITVQDSGRGVLSSGVVAVDARVDDGPWIAAERRSDGDPSTWAAQVFVPAQDDHVIKVRAMDANSTSVEDAGHRVVVTTPTMLRDLSRQTYLGDLLAFAADRLWVRAPDGGPAEPPYATAEQIGEALGQDVAAVARMSPAEATAPVRTLRLVVETLARYVRPGPPAPLAAWPLHEGEGATVEDTAGGRATGTVVNAAWDEGTVPPVLRFDPDDAAHVRVSAEGAAQVRVADRFTLVARVRPSRDTAEPGIVINKEGEYEIARFPDGTLQWAFAGTAPGWTWIDTGAVAPLGRWTHIALACDGSRVRTWTDGVLRHTAEVSGPVGDAHPADNELWIGGRPAMAQFFAGDIADVAVFGRALNEADLHRLLGKEEDGDGARLWVDDTLPDGAETDTDQDSWEWVTENPAPSTGVRCHRSQITAGRHQHRFRLPATGFPVDRGDVLVTDVWVDPLHPPRQIMLQWQDADGSWEHRAYWGEDLIDRGTDQTDSRRRIGALPEPGEWVTLRVPARLVGLEHSTVHGIGYVLFDGRAAWDRTGRMTARAAAATSGHLQAAYQALLGAHGTSEVELRLARGATPAQRTALAQRLGIALRPTRPDELDELLVSRGGLNAAALETLFGYADPLKATEPLPQTAALTRWRLAALRTQWRRTDHGTPGAVGQTPVLDPEVVVAEDCADPAGSAAGLLRDRIAWRDTQLRTLTALRDMSGDDAAAVNNAVATVLAGVDLDQLAAARRAGQDITEALTTVGLIQRDMLRLLQLRDLAGTGPLHDDEWDDVVTALVRVLRRRNWATWRSVEATVDVVVDPAVFRDAAQATGTALPSFIDATARQDWLDRLAARALAVESAAAAQTAACARAEDAALPLVRDALLRTIDPGIPGLSVADALSSVLFMDVGAGPEDVTSRVDQAIEAVQGIVFSARTNRLLPQGPWPPAGHASSWQLRQTDAYSRADFDEELRWTGAHAAWQTAVSVFFRPELMLYPALRPGTTPSYAQFLRELTAAGGDLTPQTAREQAAAYKKRLKPETRAALEAVVVSGKPLIDWVLTDQLTSIGLAALAKGQRSLIHGATALRDLPPEVQETMWLVPLQSAIALSRIGEDLAAIDWLRTLYAYDQTGADRIIFAGFLLEEGPPTVLQRPLNWPAGDELNPHRIAEGRAGAHLRFTKLLLARCLAEQADAEFTADTPESRPRARELYLAALRSLHSTEFDDPPEAPRVPANPLLEALRGRVAANLGRLRRGLTIAGVPRPAPAAHEGTASQLVVPALDGGPLTPPTRPPRPTPYRYATLVARAQQLLSLAAPVEEAYQAALVGADAEGYTEQQAGADLELSRARAVVQQAAVDAADQDVKVAQAQVLRAKRQAETLEGWIAAGPSEWERDLLDSYQQIAATRQAMAESDAGLTMASAAAAATTAWGAGMLGAVALAAALRSGQARTLAQQEARSQDSATRAGYERRSQQLQLEASLARDDEVIVAQQGEVLRRRAVLAAEEHNVATAQERHAQAAVNYLAGRRLTAEMKAWIAGQLGEVRCYLLRQATSVAQMAQQQLAFERQQPPPEIIKTSYLTVSAAAAQRQNEPERYGLSGSARLLRDLTELDQHAFETNRRKLNLDHVFSLSRTAPEAFAEFRRTGVLRFCTPMEAFDRRFPGHFLRTIRRIRLSVVALVPAAQGIAATLTCSGQSKVVVGQYGVFQPITLTRPPETVAYTSPVGATGIFELDPQPELKYFSEDHGVHTTWELQMPRAANPLDFRAIADVLVTMEYTALADPDYARQVRAALPQSVHGTLPLSLRDTFPDAWYTLHERDPDNLAAIPPVTLPVTEADFPSNLDNVRLEAVALLVIRSGERAEGDADIAVDHLDLVRGNRRIHGGAATATGDIISTRLGTGSAWLPLTDPPNQAAPPGESSSPWAKTPTGEWELALADDADTREALRDGAIADLVLVLSYRADLPAWPA